jgi:Tfp pilus assembly protein PilN
MLNLLPPQYKEELKREENFRLALILGALMFVFFICLSLLLLSIRIYVSGVINEQKILVETQTEAYERERIPGTNISDLNRSVSQVSALYNETTQVSLLLGEITQALPSGVYVNSLQYTRGEPIGKIALSGFAPTTEDLLALQANLEENERFSNFFFPVANWIDPVDINFSFSFEIGA